MALSIGTKLMTLVMLFGLAHAASYIYGNESVANGISGWAAWWPSAIVAVLNIVAILALLFSEDKSGRAPRAFRNQSTSTDCTD